MPSQDHAASAPPSPLPPGPPRAPTGRHPAWRDPDDLTLEGVAARATRGERIAVEARERIGAPPDPMVDGDKGTGALGKLFELVGDLASFRREVRDEVGTIRTGLAELTHAVNASEAARAAAAAAATAKAKTDADAAEAERKAAVERGPRSWWVRTAVAPLLGLIVLAIGTGFGAFLARHVVIR